MRSQELTRSEQEKEGKAIRENENKRGKECGSGKEEEREKEVSGLGTEVQRKEELVQEGLRNPTVRKQFFLAL